jgi:uncharacterized protein (TIGR02271 family)
MATTVVGLFDDRDAAAEAVKDLREEGFQREQISMVAADPEGKLKRYATDEAGDRSGEGAAIGAVSGLALGGVLGYLLGAGIIFLPLGFVAAGTVAAALGGAAVGAAAGGLVGAFIGMGIPREHAEVYAEGVRRGGTLVTVRCESEDGIKTASKVLDRDGAVDVEERGAAYRAEGFTRYDANKPVYNEQEAAQERARYARPVEQQTIPVVQETQTVEKQQVPIGGVRVRQYVTETPLVQGTDIREEHVNVERRPVDRPADPAMLDAFKEGVIEIPEMTEVPVVTKEPRVVEEVVINKSSTQQPAQIEDTVRRTNVDIDPISDDIDRRYTGEMQPAYDYGVKIAADERAQGYDWGAIEPQVRERWESRNPNSFERYRDAIRAGYERARARSRGARML